MDSCQNLCKNVQKTYDEKAIYLKLVDRTASRFLCLTALAKKKWDGREPLEKKNPLLSGKRQLCIIPLKKEFLLFIQTKRRNSFFLLNHDYFLINNDFPVISAGCSIPIISIIVGTMSAKHPPSRSV